MARAWDVLRGDTSDWDDRFYYLEIIHKHGQPVLDVGCGTGRLLLDYLQQGVDMDGVDNSPEMLELCRQKAALMGLEARIYESYMETLDLPRRYQTILVPSSSFQLIVDAESADAALKRLKAHLLPGGIIAASIMTLWTPGSPLESEWEQISAPTEEGLVYRKEAYSRYDPECECESTSDLYQVIREGTVVEEEWHERSPAVRSYSQEQARAVFEDAGFSDVRLYSGFTFDPVKPGDTLFVVTGRRKG